MARCPNCGLETKRTKDWSCQWCGYPLFSKVYKKIEKTYRELKEENPPQQPAINEAELKEGTEEEVEFETVTEVESKPSIETEPEPVLEVDSEVEIKSEAKEEPITQFEPEPEQELVPEQEPEPEPEPESEPEIKEEIVPELEPEPAAIEITVEELLSAYETEGADADAKFTNQILKITGTVGRIEVKAALNIYYITLDRVEKNRLLQSVRCVFDGKHEQELNQLTAGQMVTVQGKYDGSIININLRDCFIVH
jgi:hypothetical protein